jgi:sulfite reductase (ferredoxin)
MQSFRTELENPLIEKDIIDLANKIRLYREGKIHDEKFRSLRLARGVYGQRQQGVQMVRIKLPYGKMTLKQWKRIADISDEYSTGNLHFTTRQDVQIHFVSLDRTPELWAKLEEEEITLREACGNTVRNVTASVTAGIDPNEPFDITPYADALFRYFLRNPICQEMGRKIKMAFSNTDEDTALTYMHDVGFIPKIVDGKRGFKIVVGGGLGAQPMLANVAYEFLEENQMIPFVESVLRVFDRHGERNSRNKARLKFLIQKIGFETFMNLVNEERISLKVSAFQVSAFQDFDTSSIKTFTNSLIHDSQLYNSWKATNVFKQKQEGFFGVFVRVPLGNISSTISRSLIEKLEGYIGDDVRVTINQGLFLRFVPEQNLPLIYTILAEHNLAEGGANSIANITACPGTDTCNLAISDSVQITYKLEDVIRKEFPDLIHDNHIKIKISGCMNSCGQHGMANIGFHGSSLKSADKRVLPALQVLLGGGTVGNGVGRVSDKVIKVPSKRGPLVLRTLLNDYEQNHLEGEYFNDYYDRNGEKYFYELLKPLADLSTLIDTDFIDWGHDEVFQTEIGVGECASVIIDLVATLFYEGEEKMTWAAEAYLEGRYADAIYYAYQGQIHAAKGLLLDKNQNYSTQHGVINGFNEHYGEEFGVYGVPFDFKQQVMQINQNEPTKEFAKTYLAESKEFINNAIKFREESLLEVA